MKVGLVPTIKATNLCERQHEIDLVISGVLSELDNSAGLLWMAGSAFAKGFENLTNFNRKLFVRMNAEFFKISSDGENRMRLQIHPLELWF